MSAPRRLIPYAGFDPDETQFNWGEREPTPHAWWSLPDGPTRRPAYKVRSKTVTLSLTPDDCDFIRDEAQRRGIAPCRLLGDLVEAVIARKLFTEILGDPRGGGDA